MPLYTTEMDWKQRNPNVTVLQSWTFVMVPETASSVFQCTLINCHTTRTYQTRDELMNIRATSPDDLFISFITSSADIVTILVHKVRHCRCLSCQTQRARTILQVLTLIPAVSYSPVHIRRHDYEPHQ